MDGTSKFAGAALVQQRQQGRPVTASLCPTVDIDTLLMDPMYQYHGRMVGQNSSGPTSGRIGLDDGKVGGLRSVSWAQSSNVRHLVPSTQWMQFQGERARPESEDVLGLEADQAFMPCT